MSLLLAFVLVLGIYVIPNAVARIGVSHAWQFNSSGVDALLCGTCHSYIFDEANASFRTQEVMQAHRNAAGNTSYTLGWLNITVDNTTTTGFCLFCHRNQLSATSSHTKTTIRACTDLDCHGNNATTNNTAYPEGTMGPKLGGNDIQDPTNAHMRVFNTLSKDSTTYINETGASYTTGFYFCLGCHTGVGVTINYSGTEAWNHTNFESGKKRYL
jgi:hypothetical protein